MVVGEHQAVADEESRAEAVALALVGHLAAEEAEEALHRVLIVRVVVARALIELARPVARLLALRHAAGLEARVDVDHRGT